MWPGECLKSYFFTHPHYIPQEHLPYLIKRTLPQYLEIRWTIDMDETEKYNNGKGGMIKCK